MFLVLKKLIPASLSLVLACTASANAPASGFLEGHLNIVSSKEVELADGNAPETAKEGAEKYAEYPLIIFSGAREKEIARVTANGNGDFRAALPPGDYVLDVEGRAPGHLRAKPRQFQVVSGQTVRVDMEIDTGVR